MQESFPVSENICIADGPPGILKYEIARSNRVCWEFMVNCAKFDKIGNPLLKIDVNL